VGKATGQTYQDQRKKQKLVFTRLNVME